MKELTHIDVKIKNAQIKVVSRRNYVFTEQEIVALALVGLREVEGRGGVRRSDRTRSSSNTQYETSRRRKLMKRAHLPALMPDGQAAELVDTKSKALNTCFFARVVDADLS